MSQKWETTPKIVTGVNKKVYWQMRMSVPAGEYRFIVGHVPRNRERQAAQSAPDYLLDGDVSTAIYTALGVSSSTYYRRIKESDYPAQKNCARLLTGFTQLSRPADQVR